MITAATAMDSGIGLQPVAASSWHAAAAAVAAGASVGVAAAAERSRGTSVAAAATRCKREAAGP